MKIEGAGKCMRIYVGESDQWHHKPLYQAILELLREDGLAGATVLRGVAGFGANSHIHTASVLRISEDLPMVVEVIDRADRIDQILPRLNGMVSEGLITTMDVDIAFYRPNEAG